MRIEKESMGKEERIVTVVVVMTMTRVMVEKGGMGDFSLPFLRFLSSPSSVLMMSSFVDGMNGNVSMRMHERCS